ncbi:Uncharacterised protein [[Ruminococcus] torques]|uniref:Uncharacterized protein n=1 Tax=[Ruminococcus] torques TaxID=33039 RepID=A0A564SAT5_9FIRM|nr:hypothetical protein [[Ruminococcus] torques]VUW92149.1 Uncharacterised protein [[Ruminococcus] torques]
MKKTVKGAIGVIAAAGLVVGGYFGYGVLGTKAGKVVNEVQSKVKQTVNSKDKKGQKNNTKNMNYSGWYINRISTYLPFYKSSDELTDDVLQEIYISAMDYYCSYRNHIEDDGTVIGIVTSEYMNNYRDRMIISDDSLIERSDSNKQWIFKGDTFDELNQILDVEFDFSKFESDHIVYDGEKFVVTFTGDKDDQQESEIKGIYSGEEADTLNIFQDIRADQGEEIIKKHIVLVPEDNEWGYKIKSVEKGYIEFTLPMDKIGSCDEQDAIADILENYQSGENNQEECVQKLAEGWKSFTRGNFELQDKLALNESKYNREILYEWCEIAGISRKESKAVEIDNDEVALNAEEYKIKEFANGPHYIPDDRQIESYHLRVDTDKKEAINYSLIVSKDEDTGAVVLKKQNVVYEPEKNIYGYQIKSISTEEWNDEYSQELEQIELTTWELEEQWSHAGAREQIELNQKIKEIWTDEFQNIVTRLSEKYPDKKDEIEQLSEEFLSEIEEMDTTVEDESDSEAMYDEKDTILLNQNYQIQAKCYYMVGNGLMGDRIDEIVRTF